MSDRISITKFRGLSKMRTGTGKRLSDIAETAIAKAEKVQVGVSAASEGQTKRYVVGIDPGVKTGFAVWDRNETNFKCVETLDFWAVYRGLTVGFVYSPANTVVVVEVAHHAPVFRERKAKGLNQNHAARLAQNVGQVMREAKLLAEGLRRCGYEVIEKNPLGKKKTAADDKTQFEQLTGWTERTSQHARDAARLCFQR